MESIAGKAFDANRKLDEINELLEKYSSVLGRREDGYLDVLRDMSAKIVSALTEVMKVADGKLSDRACEVVDEINSEYDSIWIFTGEQEKAGEPLMSLLKELARKGLIPQINKIFMTSNGGSYPLVNWLSTGPLTKRKLDELLKMLPQDYQEKLRNGTVSFSDGDKDYSCSLIGGSALMSF